MLAEIDGYIVLNKEKFHRFYKRGQKPTKEILKKYMEAGGAVLKVEKTKKKEVVKKKVVKKKK